MTNSLQNPIFNPERIGFSYIDEWNRAVATAPRRGPNPEGPEVLARYLSDNGKGDLASSEITSRILEIERGFRRLQTGRWPGVVTSYDNTPPQNLLAGAFRLTQLALDSVAPENRVIFLNCAPRREEAKRHVQNNGGESVWAGALPNGTVVAGTGPGVFTFLRDWVAAGKLVVHRLKVDTDGSQFRSRDYFPFVLAVLARHATGAVYSSEWIGTEERNHLFLPPRLTQWDITLPTEAIPVLPNKGLVVADVDEHGNLKLGRDDVQTCFQDCEKVWVVINGQAQSATVHEKFFDTPPGEIGLILHGSSGHWVRPDDSKGPGFAEVIVRNDSAKKLFGLTKRDLFRGAEVHVVPQGGFVYTPAGGRSQRRQVRTPEEALRVVRAQLVRGLGETQVLTAPQL